MTKFIDHIRRNERGTAIVEFTLVLPMLLMMTFGISEFGFLYYQWNSAEKATQLGTRVAITNDPVIIGLTDCGVATTAAAGTNCRNVPGSDSWTVSCSGDSVTAPCDPVPLTLIVAQMQAVYPYLQPENILVEFSGAGLGFVGRGSPVPVVSVSIQNRQFEFIVLGGLLGFGPIDVPPFKASLIGEDLNSSGAS